MTEAMSAAALEVFGSMMGIAIEPEKIEPGQATAVKDHGVLSLLGITGEWTGNGGLSCSADCACWMASQMMLCEFPEVNDEVRDAVGEITNMIVGSFKNSISNLTGPLGMSTPTVISGQGMTTTNSESREWIAFPFHSEGHSFRMIVQLQPAGRVTSRAHDAMQHLHGALQPA